MGGLDVNAVFKIIQSGGPPTIFVLLFILSLLLTGVLRVKREVEVADGRWKEQKGVNDELLGKLTRQQDLFERSLDLLEPLLHDQPPSRRRPWPSGD